jgi:NitT/TauT family transport system substrate-binding protein
MSACGVVGRDGGRRDLVPLKVMIVPQPSYAPLFVAQDEGFFADEGLAVEFVRLTRSADGLPALMQGDLDVTGDFVGVGYLNAMARGARVRFVADKGYIPPSGCDSNVFVASPALAERAGDNWKAHVKGLKIGANERSMSGFLADRMVADAGVPAEAVEVVDMPRAIMDQAIGRSLDLGFLMEPAVTRTLRDRRGAVWRESQKIAPDFQLAHLAFGPNLLDGKPGIGERFMVAYLRAVQQLKQGKTDRNVQILAGATGDDPALVRESCWPAFRSDGRFNLASVPEFQEWAIGRGLLDRLVPEEEFWEPRFVEHANRVLAARNP